jgi:hypothetical protein
MTSYPEALTVKMSMKKEFSIIEITFLRTNDTDIAHTKNHICG